MVRFFTPFLCALSIHLLLACMSWENEPIQQPVLGGNESISIHLDNFNPQKKSKKKTIEKEVPPIPTRLPSSTMTIRAQQPNPQPPQPTPQSSISKLISAQNRKITKQKPKQHTPTNQPSQKQWITAEQNRHKVNTRGKAQDNATTPVAIKASPLYRHNTKPTYPPLARRRGWEGTVILLVSVNTQGLVDKITVIKESGHTILDKTARKSVRRWLFTPGMVDNRAISMEVQIPVHFKLNESHGIGKSYE